MYCVFHAGRIVFMRRTWCITLSSSLVDSLNPAPPETDARLPESQPPSWLSAYAAL